MNRRTLIIIGVAVLAVGGYLVYRWYKNQQSGNPSPTGGLGSNLNSVAPELVGGSSGPSLGPAVSLPVNITLTSSVPDMASVPPRPIPSGNDGDQDKTGGGATGPPVKDTGLISAMNSPDTTTPAGVTMQCANSATPSPVKRQATAAKGASGGGSKVHSGPEKA